MQRMTPNRPPANPPDDGRKLTPAEEADERRLNHIPPALRERIDEIKGWLTNESRRSLLAHYHLGRIVREVYDDDEKYWVDQRYGQMSMRKLCHALPLSASLLYEALRVAQVFTEEEVDRLAQVQTTSGRLLSWTHLHLLATLGEDRRDGMLARVVREDLTADQLAAEIRRQVGKANGRGRKPVPPRNLGGVIDQQAACADRFLERAPLWADEHSLLERVQSLPREGHTEEMAERLRAHRDRLWQLAREATARAQEADRAYETFCKALARAKEAAAAEGGQDSGREQTEEPVSVEDACAAAAT
jgi:hypothetical protein